MKCIRKRRKDIRIERGYSGVSEGLHSVGVRLGEGWRSKVEWNVGDKEQSGARQYLRRCIGIVVDQSGQRKLNRTFRHIRTDPWAPVRIPANSDSS